MEKVQQFDDAPQCMKFSALGETVIANELLYPSGAIHPKGTGGVCSKTQGFLRFV